MSQTAATVTLYYMPQSFPCGPNSGCCGPVGQSDAELQQWTQAVHDALPDVTIEPVNVSEMERGRNPSVERLLDTFGVTGLPVFAVGDEVVSMGLPNCDELVNLIREKFTGVHDTV